MCQNKGAQVNLLLRRHLQLGVPRRLNNLQVFETPQNRCARYLQFSEQVINKQSLIQFWVLMSCCIMPFEEDHTSAASVHADAWPCHASWSASSCAAARSPALHAERAWRMAMSACRSASPSCSASMASCAAFRYAVAWVSRASWMISMRSCICRCSAPVLSRARCAQPCKRPSDGRGEIDRQDEHNTNAA